MMKLFKSTDNEIVKYCQNIFRFELPSICLSGSKKRFLASYNSVDNSVFRHILTITFLLVYLDSVHLDLSKHFYFSLPTAVKHVLADFCNAPSVRL